jgi:hypothetical protein
MSDPVLCFLEGCNVLRLGECLHVWDRDDTVRKSRASARPVDVLVGEAITTHHVPEIAVCVDGSACSQIIDGRAHSRLHHCAERVYCLRKAATKNETLWHTRRQKVRLFTFAFSVTVQTPLLTVA